MKTAVASLKRKYPFASEFVTDKTGRVSKVVLDLPTFKRLMEELEDSGMRQAMRQVRHEKPLSKTEALAELARE